MTTTNDTTRMRRIVENGAIKFRRVPVTAEDIIAEKNNEIKHLHELIDTLRARVEQLEQEQQRQQLRDEPSDTAESYQIYK